LCITEVWKAFNKNNRKVNTLVQVSDKIRDKLNGLPSLPGIYKMLDSKGNIIYIGKSKCLKNRVRSYFSVAPKWEKVKKMVFFIDDIDYIVTDTHLEARLLECELIKKFQPSFNAQMKNDSKYVYLKIENYNRFRALSVVSEREAYTYGPFRNKHSLRDIIDLLKHIFPITKRNEAYKFDYHIMPNVMDQETFNENRKHLVELFSDNAKMLELKKALTEKMEEASILYKFETASKYRDIIQGLDRINHGIWHYKKLMSQDILLNIPIKRGFKLFFISNGSILQKEKYDELTEEVIDLFIKNVYSNKPSISINQDEKAGIDFRDILYSEIISLPEEMVMYLHNT